MAERKAEKAVNGSDTSEAREVLLTVEEHAQAQNVAAEIVAAVKERERWLPGKRVSEKEFRGAVTAFLSTPMGGKA